MFELLRDACADLEPPLSSAQIEQLAIHWAALCAWNAVHNLTAVRDPTAAAWLHYRDSLAPRPHLTAGPVLDVGSGAGFPGLVLAVAQPQHAFVLMEPRRKRRSFLELAVAQLRLSNVRLLGQRSDVGMRPDFACVLTRATFSDSSDLLALRAWLRPHGLLVALRSPQQPRLPGARREIYALRGEERALDLLSVAG